VRFNAAVDSSARTLAADARRLARGALLSLERNRRRIDDLNVYPVPDGDTGTNLVLTVRAAVERLDATSADDLATLARDVTHATLMGARGNSGVILSQMVRGFAGVAAGAERLDAVTLARAFRAASDAAYAAVREPVEGTMLTVIRTMAEAAEANAGAAVHEQLAAVVRGGADAVAATPRLLDVLRAAGVVDAGGAGLLELVRGVAATFAGEPLPEATAEDVPTIDAIHQELSRYRYCTTFVVEGADLDRDAVERALEPLGDSLLVVGDADALKVHVHTDDPGAALTLGTAIGTLEGVEIANMHAQTERREERLLRAAAEATASPCELVAVVAGAGNRALFASEGATQIVDGGQSMNPSAAELVAAIERTRAPTVFVLPNSANVVLAAEQAAALADRDVRVVPSRSISAGLAAAFAFDAAQDADENARAMGEALAAVATGAVTVASKDARLDGLVVTKGDFLGLADEEPVAQGTEFEEVAQTVVERLLAEPREIVTLLAGADEPDLSALVRSLEERHPDLVLEVHDGGQPHYSLLIAAE
jgi:DAK2 domain fusion protein YloV